jgi:hypothetical protein
MEMKKLGGRKKFPQLVPRKRAKKKRKQAATLNLRPI